MSGTSLGQFALVPLFTAFLLRRGLAEHDAVDRRCSASSSTWSSCSGCSAGDPKDLGKEPYGHAAAGGRRRRSRRSPAGEAARRRHARRRRLAGAALARPARGHAHGVLLAVHRGHVRVRRRRLPAHDAPRADGHRPRRADLHGGGHAGMVRSAEPGRDPARRSDVRPRRRQDPHRRGVRAARRPVPAGGALLRTPRRSGCCRWGSGSRS